MSLLPHTLPIHRRICTPLHVMETEKLNTKVVNNYKDSWGAWQMEGIMNLQVFSHLQRRLLFTLYSCLLRASDFFFGQACMMGHHVHSSKSRMNVLQPFLFVVVFPLKPWKASLWPFCFIYQFKQWSSRDLIGKYKHKWFSKEHPQKGTTEVSERSTESHSWLYYTKYCSLTAGNCSGSHLLSSCSL